MKTVWLAGGSGLVGGELLRLLLADDAFAKVVSVVRRRLSMEAPKLLQVKVDFADAASFDALEAPAIAFCCLGTTIKKAGSPAAFRAVDYDAVLAFAKAARDKGASVFVHVTSLGANPKAVALYTRVKGEVEAALAELGFASVYALRPSLIDGERAERRTLERMTLSVARALSPVLGRYRPTSSSAIACVMIAKAKAAEPGAHVVDAREIA